MPHQQQQPQLLTYMTVLSVLRKFDLLRLCNEFRLPTDGSVVNLRAWLRGYLNFNHNMLLVNPRFTALFLRHSHHTCAHPSPPAAVPRASPALSYIPSSPAQSFNSWYRIDAHLEQPPIQQPPIQQPPIEQPPFEQPLVQPSDVPALA